MSTMDQPHIAPENLPMNAHKSCQIGSAFVGYGPRKLH